MLLTTDIMNELLPGLNKVCGQPPTVEEVWKDIFKVYSSDLAFERDVMMSFLGPASIKAEGAPMASGQMAGERFITTYPHKTVSNSFSISEEAQEDNQYLNQFPANAEQFKNSFAETKNMLGANIFNNAFNPAHVWGDGKPLCATDHPLDTGSYSNMLTPEGIYVDFSEAALEQAIIQISKFRRQNGMFSNAKPEMLVIPPELMFAAGRILESEGQPGTANNDKNMLRGTRYFRKGYVINQYLASSTAFFVTTNIVDGFKLFQRRKLKTGSYVVDSTQAIVFFASERYSMGVTDTQAVLGSQGV